MLVNRVRHSDILCYVLGGLVVSLMISDARSARNTEPGSYMIVAKEWVTRYIPKSDGDKCWKLPPYGGSYLLFFIVFLVKPKRVGGKM